jgi:hypothetical protein
MCVIKVPDRVLMGSKSGKTSSSPGLRMAWCTGGWQRKASCKVTGQFLDTPIGDLCVPSPQPGGTAYGRDRPQLMKHHQRPLWQIQPLVEAALVPRDASQVPKA